MQVNSQLVWFVLLISLSSLNNFCILLYSSHGSINYFRRWRRNMSWHTSAEFVAKHKYKTSSWWPGVLAHRSFGTRIDKHKLTFDTELAIDLRLWFSITGSGSVTTGPLFSYHILFPSWGFWFLLYAFSEMIYDKGNAMIHPRETLPIVN